MSDPITFKAVMTEGGGHFCSILINMLDSSVSVWFDL
jgi:hypothetical protein